MIFQMAAAIQLAKRNGLVVPVVYNSNGYDSVDALRQIRGLVDIYIPDIKYLENELGKKFSNVDDYADIVPGVLREMLNQAGHLEMDDDGIAVRGLLVRHLVLPGYLENSRQCLSFLKDLSPDIHVSIMSQYSPQYKARDFPEINRTLTETNMMRSRTMHLSLAWKTPLYRNSKVRPVTCLILIRNGHLNLTP